jgi:PAS domain S-box-containing protein
VPAVRPPAAVESEAAAHLLQGAVEEAATLLEADGAMIYLLDPDGQTLRFAHDAGIADLARRRWVRRLRLTVGEGMFGVAVADRRVVATRDYPADRTFTHASDPDRFVREVGLRSMVVAPLVHGERVFGGLGTFSTRPDAFSDAQIGLVRALADHAAAAMANTLLIAELDRSRSELARRAEVEHELREIATRISSIRSPDDVIQQAVDAAARLLAADGARIDLIDPVLNLLRWAYQSGGSRPTEDVWPRDPNETLDQGVSGKAVTEGSVERTGDYLRDRRFVHGETADQYIDAVGVHSVMSAPLIGEDGAFGALTVYTTQVDAWSEADAELIDALATEAAIAITNARLIAELGASREALARRAEAERALREIAARLTAIREPSELLQHVVDEANRLVRADGTILDLLDPATGRLQWAYDSGLSAKFTPEQLGELWLPVGVGATGIAVAEDRVVTAGDDLRNEFPPSPESDLFFSTTGFRSLIAAPVATDAGPLGALEVYSARAFAFDDADAALIRSLADQAAIAIGNARLIEELARSREEVARRADSERTLREIAARLTAMRDPNEVLEQVVGAATRLLRARGGMIDLVGTSGVEQTWTGSAETATDIPIELLQDIELDPDAGVSGLAVATGVVQWTGDYLADARFRHTPERDQFVSDAEIRSVIAAPLVVGSEAVGAITVFSSDVDAFGPEDEAIARALADQAAVTIANTRLIEALERARDEVERRAEAEGALRRINASLSAIREPDVILQQSVDEARRLLDSDSARIDLLEGQLLLWRYASGDPGVATREHALESAIPLGVGVAGTAVARGTPFRTGNYLADDGFVHNRIADAYIRRHRVRSVLSVPLVGEIGPLGALTVSSTKPERFTDEHAELLQALADQAAIAIQNARLIEELQRSRADLARRVETERSLREVAARIAVLRDPDEVLARIVDEARRLIGSDSAHLTRLSEDGGYVVPEVVAGGLDADAEAWLRGQRFPLDAGINGLAAGRGEPIWTEDYRIDPRIPLEPDDLDTAERLGLRGMAAVPLRSAEAGIIGTLAVSFRQPHRFDDEEIGLLQVLADHAAIAMTNASLYERLRRSESSYRHLVQNSPDLVWAIDADARLFFVSDTAERLTGWKPEELIGRHFGDLVHESSREVAEIDWTAGMSAGSQEIRGRLSLLHRDGRAIPAEFIAIGALDADGRFIGANGSVRDMTDLDRLERELRASEARYRNLLQSSPDLIWAADPDGRYTFMSDRVREILGWDPADWVGHHFGEFLAGESAADAAAADAAIHAAPGEVVRVRLLLHHADGREIPFEVHAVGLADDGMLVAVNGVARDVSEREALERGLRDSEARFRQLVQTTPDVIWRADANGVFAFMADNGEALFGYPIEEIVGRHFGLLTSDDTMPIARANYAALATEPDVVRHVPLTLVRRDGSTFEAEVTVVGVFEDGRFVGGQGTVRDVSARERLQRELRESEERYRFLVENSPDVIFSIDADGRYAFMSESIERVTGYRQTDVIGRPFVEFVPEDQLPVLQDLWLKHQQEPAVEAQVRIELLHADGRRVPFEVSSVGLARDGRFAGIQGVARDVSDREALERDLRRQAGELAAGEERAHLARELHDSVTQALFSMTLLSRSIEMLVDRDAETAKHKLSELRDLQREALAEMRALIFELRPGNLEQEGLITALRTHSAALQGRIGLPIVVTSDLTERLPIEIEEVMYRIAQEALHNVVKHAAAHQVRIEVGRSTGGARLRIVDDGKGFDPAAVPPGHLGLAGMRARAERVGGRVDVRSSMGGGTTIDALVPLEARAIAPSGTAASAD